MTVSDWTRQSGWGSLPIAILLLLGCAPGCMIVDVGVTNPVPDVRTVAVVPFFNQSDERAVDGRNLANLYAVELQKTPGVEVIPVGVVHTAMRQYNMEDLAGPPDAVKLARLLNVDAVVIGSVTEFDSYNPPRIGLSIAWYAPGGGTFQPGVPVDPDGRHRIRKDLHARRKAGFRAQMRRLLRRDSHHDGEEVICEVPAIPQDSAKPADTPPTKPGDREQSVPPKPPAPGISTRRGHRDSSDWKPPPAPASEDAEPKKGDDRFKMPVIIRGQSPILRAPGRLVSNSGGSSTTVTDGSSIPIRPLMSYTKVFDAGDAGTSAAFRDYLELSGDPREGNWSSRLQWADDFPRFAMHMMIVEMFQLHGGQARRRVVLKWRNHK